MDGGSLDGQNENARPQKTLSKVRNSDDPEGVRIDTPILEAQVLRIAMPRFVAGSRDPIRASSKALQKKELRGVWDEKELGYPSRRRKSSKQRLVQLNDFVRELSYGVALAEWENFAEHEAVLCMLREACQKNYILRHALPAVQETWRSLDGQARQQICEKFAENTRRRNNNPNKHRVKAMGATVIPQIIQIFGEWIKECLPD